jgi:hypothetical protein
MEEITRSSKSFAAQLVESSRARRLEQGGVVEISKDGRKQDGGDEFCRMTSAGWQAGCPKCGGRKTEFLIFDDGFWIGEPIETSTSQTRGNVILADYRDASGRVAGDRRRQMATSSQATYRDASGRSAGSASTRTSGSLEGERTRSATSSINDRILTNRLLPGEGKLSRRLKSLLVPLALGPRSFRPLKSRCTPTELG